MDRVIIIGAGHNGLVTASYLARAGLKPLVLERRPVVGGICITEEIHPGFHCSAIAHSAGPFLPSIADDLQLAQYGLEFIDQPVNVFAPNPDGASISIYQDTKRTANELSKISALDGAAYPEFISSFAQIGKTLAPLLTMSPPDIDAPTKSELWGLGKLGWSIRGLGRKDEYRLLRYGPMAVADLASEWFESETMRALVAGRGIFGAHAGPWSAGTSAPLLLQSATNGKPFTPSSFIKGGLGSLTQALAKAAQDSGAEIRTDADVRSIQIEEGKVTGVRLANEEVIGARAVVSNADPKTTFLNLLDPAELDPGFIQKIRNYRAQGTVAKVNLALSALPKFNVLSEDQTELLGGRIHIGPDIDYLERAFDAAKYGDLSSRPYLDVTVPSLADPSLAPKGAHVMSVHVQYAPYQLKESEWRLREEDLARIVIETLAEYAPNINQLIVAGHVLTPVDLERTYGLTGGHLHHGEMALDQLFAFRPLIGWARYRTPIKGLYLCGSGTHPGGGITGASGLNASREIIRDCKQRQW